MVVVVGGIGMAGGGSWGLVDVFAVDVLSGG